jgi:hypothetical protein
MEAVMFKIPIEIFDIILESYNTVAILRTSCKYLRYFLKSLYHKKKLHASVYTGKLFFPQSQCKLTRSDEIALYHHDQKIELYYGAKMVGYAIFYFNPGLDLIFWHCYCEIPSACYVDFNSYGYCDTESDESRSDEFDESDESIKLIEFNKDSKWITFIRAINKDNLWITAEKKKNWLSWKYFLFCCKDYDHNCECCRYTNLTSALQDINLIWGRSRLFWGN